MGRLKTFYEENITSPQFPAYVGGGPKNNLAILGILAHQFWKRNITHRGDK